MMNKVQKPSYSEWKYIAFKQMSSNYIFNLQQWVVWEIWIHIKYISNDLQGFLLHCLSDHTD
jgi:hypothetical protein